MHATTSAATNPSREFINLLSSMYGVALIESATISRLDGTRGEQLTTGPRSADTTLLLRTEERDQDPISDRGILFNSVSKGRLREDTPSIRGSHVAVMDQGGTVLKSVDIPSSRFGVAGALRRCKKPIKAVLEASYAWEPMHDWLDEFADEVVLGNGSIIQDATRKIAGLVDGLTTMIIWTCAIDVFLESVGVHLTPIGVWAGSTHTVSQVCRCSSFPDHNSLILMSQTRHTCRHQAAFLR